MQRGSGEGLAGSIRRTILLIVSICIGVPALVGGMLVLGFLLSSYTALESDISRDQLNQFTEILEQDKRSLMSTALDWAQWNDAVDFVKVPKHTSMRTWLLSWNTYANVHVDLISFRTFNNESVFTAIPDHGLQAVYEASAAESDEVTQAISRMIPGKRFGENKGGIFIFRGVPYSYAAVPVLDDNRAQGGHGYLILARTLGPKFLERITPRLRNLVFLNLVTPNTITPDQQVIGTEELLLSTTLPIDNSTGLLQVQVRTPRRIFTSLRHAATAYLLGLGTITILSFCALLALLSKKISAPVEKLKNFAQEIAQTGNFSLRTSVDSKDEFGQIGENINAMLVHLEQSYQSAQLAHARADLANQAKTSFLSKASHELRTPIFNIQGYLRILRKCQHEPKSVSAIENISDSAQALLHVVNSILDFTEFSSTEISIRNSELHIGDVLNEIAIGQSSLLRPKHQELAVTICLDKRIPEYITSDERRISQVVHHLLSNGIKFTEAGSVTVVVEGDIGLLRVVVTDTGIGIECPERLESLGEFEQVEKTSNRRYDGLGLGLALSRRIISAIGGTLSIESSLHSGTVVTVEIPAQYEFDATAPVVYETIYQSKPAEMEELVPEKRLRVLVADKGILNRQLISSMVEEIGHAVTCVETGSELVDILRRSLAGKCDSEKFDVVVTDLHLAGIPGLEAVQWLRSEEERLGYSHDQKIAVMVLTGRTESSLQIKAKEAGSDAVILKPLEFEQFQQLLTQVVQRASR